eukprot:5377663-Amphidinium_carterae.3
MQVICAHSKAMDKNIERGWEQWLQHVSPFCQSNGRFVLNCPRVCDSNLHVTTKSKTVVRCIVLDTLVPLIAKGESGQADVSAMCAALADHLQMVAESSTERDLVLNETLSTLQTVCWSMLGLMRHDDPNNYIAAVNEISESRGQGARFILRNSIMQNDFWRKLQSAFLTACTAAVSITPQIEESIGRLRGSDEVDMEGTVRNVILWRDMLRPGATAALERALLARCSLIINAVERDGTANAETKIGTLQALKTSLDNLALAPVTSSLATAGISAEPVKILSADLEKRAAAISTRASEEAFARVLDIDINKSTTDDMTNVMNVLSNRKKGDVNEAQLAKLNKMAESLLTFLCKVLAQMCERGFPQQHFECYKTLVDYLDLSPDGVTLVGHYAELIDEFNQSQSSYQEVSAWAAADTGGRYSAKLHNGLKKAREMTVSMTSMPTGGTGHPAALESSVVNRIAKFLKEVSCAAKVSCEATLHDACNSVKAFIGGTRSGTSWKEHVPGDVAWGTLISAADPLIKGEVATELASNFKKLLQDRSTSLVTHVPESEAFFVRFMCSLSPTLNLRSSSRVRKAFERGGKCPNKKSLLQNVFHAFLAYCAVLCCDSSFRPNPREGLLKPKNIVKTVLTILPWTLGVRPRRKGAGKKLPLYLMCQELKKAEQTAELYSVHIEGADLARDTASKASATISEAMLLGALSCQKTARAAKKRKIQSSLDKISAWSTQLQSDVQSLVHKQNPGIQKVVLPRHALVASRCVVRVGSCTMALGRLLTNPSPKNASSISFHHPVESRILDVSCLEAAFCGSEETSLALCT